MEYIGSVWIELIVFIGLLCVSIFTLFGKRVKHCDNCLHCTINKHTGNMKCSHFISCDKINGVRDCSMYQVKE